MSTAHSEVVFVLSGQPEFPLASLFAATAPAGKRALEFFTTQISNDHTRKAYLTVLKTFSAWCEERGLNELGQVEPVHITAYLKELGQHRSAPTVKQHLSGSRMLFDWLVTGYILTVNPAHAARGPKHVLRKGKTPVLNADEAHTLLDSIETDTVVGLRDRALIGLMVYTFARVNAALQMKVASSDIYLAVRSLAEATRVAVTPSRKAKAVKVPIPETCSNRAVSGRSV